MEFIYIEELINFIESRFDEVVDKELLNEAIETGYLFLDNCEMQLSYNSDLDRFILEF